MDRFKAKTPIQTKLRLEMNFSDYKKKPQSPKMMPTKVHQLDANRKNLMDETILKIINSQSDQRLFDTSLGNTNFGDENGENQPPSTSQPEIFTPSSPLTPKMQNLTTKDHPFMSRIQRDLNSPSASVRVRALKAIKSPTKPYYFFDVPHEEQDIITEEERREPPPPPTIQEVMKDVCIFVDVRSAGENRSNSIRNVIALLGAQVTDKLVRGTTHVIFKDGLLSTYKKAKLWDIPLVSILWVDGCKKQLRLANPKLYPISNSQRYENADLHKKMKKQAELDRVPKKIQDAMLAEFPISGSVETVKSSAKKPKTHLDKFLAGGNTGSPSASPSRSKNTPTKNTPTKNTPSKNTPSKNTPTRRKKDDLSSMEKLHQLDSITLNESTILNTPNAKKSLFQEGPIDSVQISLSQEVIPMTPTTQTPRRRSLRLSSIQSLPEITKPDESVKLTPRRSSIDTSSNNKTPYTRRKTIFASSMSRTTIVEEEEDSLQSKMSKTVNTTTNMEVSFQTNSRRTICTPKPMEESRNDFLTPNNSVVNRRRTLYTPRPMEESCAGETTPVPNPVLDNFVSNNISFSSTRTPSSNKRKTMFEISMDIIDQMSNVSRLDKLNQSMNETDETPLENKITNSPNDGPQARIDSFYKQSSKSNEFVTPKNTKRKLYSIPTFDEIQVRNDVRETLTPSEKRIRKLDDSQVTQSAGKRFKTVEPVKNSRRSSIDFSQGKTDVIKRDLTKKRNSMVFTNMQQTQMNLIQEAIKTLGDFTVGEKVTDKTTHLITLGARRTTNLLRGIIRGVWILEFDLGKWLNEELYELRDFSKAIEICRTERQAFGRTYKMDIFRDVGPIYISSNCKIPFRDLYELISACSGKIVENREEAKYILSSSIKNDTNGICIDPLWVWDCISESKILKIKKYVLKPTIEF